MGLGSGSNPKFSTAAAETCSHLNWVKCGVSASFKVGSIAMIAKCANPVCSAPFHYLREGKVFRMEFDPNGSPLKPKMAASKPVRKIEHFWLCGPCSTTLTLVMNKGKVETVSIEPAVMTRAVAS